MQQIQIEAKLPTKLQLSVIMMDKQQRPNKIGSILRPEFVGLNLNSFDLTKKSVQIVNSKPFPPSNIELVFRALPDRKQFRRNQDYRPNKTAALANRRELLSDIFFDFSTMRSDFGQPGKYSFENYRNIIPTTYELDWHFISSLEPKEISKTTRLNSLQLASLVREQTFTQIDCDFCSEAIRFMKQRLFSALGKDCFNVIDMFFCQLLKREVNVVLNRTNRTSASMKKVPWSERDTYIPSVQFEIHSFSRSAVLCSICHAHDRLLNWIEGQYLDLEDKLFPVCRLCSITNPKLELIPMEVGQADIFSSAVPRCWDPELVAQSAAKQQTNQWLREQHELIINRVAKLAYIQCSTVASFLLQRPNYTDDLKLIRTMTAFTLKLSDYHFCMPKLGQLASSHGEITEGDDMAEVPPEGYTATVKIIVQVRNFGYDHVPFQVPVALKNIGSYKVWCALGVYGPDDDATACLPNPSLTSPVSWNNQRTVTPWISKNDGSVFVPDIGQSFVADRGFGWRTMTIYDVNGNTAVDPTSAYFTSANCEFEYNVTPGDGYDTLAGGNSIFLWARFLDSQGVLPGNRSLNRLLLTCVMTIYGKTTSGTNVTLTNIQLADQNVPLWTSDQKNLPGAAELPISSSIKKKKKEKGIFTQQLNGAQGSYTGTDDQDRFPPVERNQLNVRRQAEIDACSSPLMQAEAKQTMLHTRSPPELIKDTKPTVVKVSPTKVIDAIYSDKLAAINALTRVNKFVILLALGDSTEYDYQDEVEDEEAKVTELQDELLTRQRNEIAEHEKATAQKRAAMQAKGSTSTTPRDGTTVSFTQQLKDRHASERALFAANRIDNLEKIRQKRESARKDFIEGCFSSKNRFVGYVLATGLSADSAIKALLFQKPKWFEAGKTLCSVDSLVVALTILLNKKYPSAKDRALVFLAQYDLDAVLFLEPGFKVEYETATEMINNMLNATNNFGTHKLACNHCKFDGKAKQPNDFSVRKSRLASSHGEITEGDDMASSIFPRTSDVVEIKYPQSHVTTPPASSSTAVRPLGDDLARVRGYVYGLQTGTTTVDSIVGDVFCSSQATDNTTGNVASHISREVAFMGRQYYDEDENVFNSIYPLQWVLTTGVAVKNERNTYADSEILTTIELYSARLNATVTMTNGFYNTDILTVGQICQPGDNFDYQFLKVWLYCFSVAPTGAANDTISLRGSVEHIDSRLHFNVAKPGQIFVGANLCPLFNEDLDTDVAPFRPAGDVGFITNMKALDNEFVYQVIAVPVFIVQASDELCNLYMRLLAIMWLAGPNNFITWLIDTVHEDTNTEYVLDATPYAGLVATSGLTECVFLLPCASSVVPLPLNQQDANRAPLKRPTFGGVSVDMSFTGTFTGYNMTEWLNELLDPTHGRVGPQVVTSFINLMAAELNAQEASHAAFHYAQTLAWRVMPMQIAAYEASYQTTINGGAGSHADSSFFQAVAHYPVYPAVSNAFPSDYVFPEGTIIRYNQIVMGAKSVVSKSVLGNVTWMVNQMMYAQMESRRNAMASQLFYDSLNASCFDLNQAIAGKTPNRVWVAFFSKLFLSASNDRGINICAAGDLWNDFANEYLGTSLYCNDYGHNLMHFRRAGFIVSPLTGLAITTTFFRPLFYPDVWMDRWVSKDLINYCQPNDLRTRNNLMPVPDGEFPFGNAAIGVINGCIMAKPRKQPNYVVTDQWANFGDLATKLNQRLLHYYVKEFQVTGNNGFDGLMSTTVGGACIYGAAYQYVKGQVPNTAWANQGLIDSPSGLRGSINPYAMFDLVTGSYITRNIQGAGSALAQRLYRNITTLPLTRLIYQFDAVAPSNFLSGDAFPCPFDANINRKVEMIQDQVTTDLKDSSA
jgi:hypothetical protein